MNGRIIRGLIFLLAASSTAAAGPVIDVGTHYILASNPKKIPIAVSGGDMVEGLNFYVQVADGGTINGGTATKPKITAVDIIGPGTLFSQSNRGAQPTHLPDAGGTYLIWSDWTLTQPGVQIPAAGTLAYLTIDTAGTSASDSPYAVNLAGVGAGYYDPDSFTTDFGGVSATINAGWIVITNLRDLTWNKSNNGTWSETTWNGALPGYPTCPNYSSRAIVNTPYTVNITSAQEANALILSSGGKVAISSTGNLAITGTATVSTGGTLSISPGAALSASGIQVNFGTIAGSGSLSPAVSINGGILNTPLSSDNLVLSANVGGTGNLTKTGSGTVTLLGNALYNGDTDIAAGRLQVNGSNPILHYVTGSGMLGVGNGSTSTILTADSMQIGTLRVSANSKIIINANPSGPMTASDSLSPVPEPSTVTLLIVAALGMFYYYRINTKSV